MTTQATPPSEAVNKYLAIVASCIATNMGTSDALAASSNNSNMSLVDLTQAWTTNSNNTPIGFYTPPSTQDPNPYQPIPVYNNVVAAALYGGFYFDGPSYDQSTTPQSELETPTNPGNPSNPFGTGFSSTTFYGLPATQYSTGQWVPLGAAENSYLPDNPVPGVNGAEPHTGSVNTLISTYFGGQTSYAADLTTNMILQIMTALQNNWGPVPPSGGTNPSTGNLTICNQELTYVSAAATTNEQSLQTLCSTLTNMLGQSQNGLQTLVSGGSAVNQMVGAEINAMGYY